MPQIPVRRAQLISPFGPGAMMVTKSGVSLITAGIDHWYKRDDGTSKDVDIDQFVINEWRLERELGVSHFRLPPDYRYMNYEDDAKNLYLTVPFLRFPKYHHCRRCFGLLELPLTATGKQLCPHCKRDNVKSRLVQVRFIAMCDHGHVQDFPWNEWVHHSTNPTCDRQLFMKATGGAGLGGVRVWCECGKAERTLEGIMTAFPDGNTALSQRLESDDKPFLCRGHRPWLGTDDPEDCGQPLRGALRSASNVYYPQIKSALFIPNQENGQDSTLAHLLSQQPYLDIVEMLYEVNASRERVIEKLRRQYVRELSGYTDEALWGAYQKVCNQNNTTPAELNLEGEILIRHEEYNVIRSAFNNVDLMVREADMDEYSSTVRNYISNISLIDKVKETRVLYGFRRVNSEGDQDVHHLKTLLRRWKPHSEGTDWLPAYTVFGEGVFLQLNEKRLKEWEQRENVINRANPLRSRAIANAPLGGQRINPRFVLIHTLAHLLINQLTFDCGYSSTALRERLYIDQENDMAGLLIYTAAGDSEGTMGGLVRMGKPEFFESVFERAIRNAQWCSSDPVCMEIGGTAGQGPDSLNLAACHSCALVPETSCEEFNRYLDRALVVGSLEDEKLGYISL